jgi:DnaJ-class molecular chaperone
MPVVDGDFYAVLGVDAGVDDEELRVAWRRLAARWHPDRAGAGATATFQQISAAYTVLSDPLTRAAYDGRRRAAGPKSAATPAPAATETVRPARPSAPAVMLSRLTGHLSKLLARCAVHLDEPGYVTLLLSPGEAAQGGMATVSMQVDLWCPDCAMRGRAEVGCGRCGGRRTVVELYSAWLAIRPGVADGDVLVPSAELPGMVEPVRFRVELQGAR